MLICAAGDIHGTLDRLYADILDFENSLGVRFEWVLHRIHDTEIAEKSTQG